jgi:hypothetical protein
MDLSGGRDRRRSSDLTLSGRFCFPWRRKSEERIRLKYQLNLQNRLQQQHALSTALRPVSRSYGHAMGTKLECCKAIRTKSGGVRNGVTLDRSPLKSAAGR